MLRNITQLINLRAQTITGMTGLVDKKKLSYPVANRKIKEYVESQQQEIEMTIYASGPLDSTENVPLVWMTLMCQYSQKKCLLTFGEELKISSNNKTL